MALHSMLCRRWGNVSRSIVSPLRAATRSFNGVSQPFSRTLAAETPMCRAQWVAQRACAGGVAKQPWQTATPSTKHLPEIAPAAEYDLLVADIFRTAAREHPQRIALDGPSFQMTYAELDAVTDNLAAFLRQNYRAVPETVVGIYMERCEEYVIAMLAIWKAGAAYVPIELAYPGPLLQSVFEEVNACVVLTKERYAQNVPMSTSRFLLDGDWSSVLERAAPNVAVLEQDRATPESLSYIIYSGGSTGKPKGIEAPHRSPVASYLWRNSISGYGPGSRVGCNVFFVWEVLRPLMRGGTTVVIPDNVIFDMALLAPYLESKAITEVLFTPSLFETLLDTVKPELLQKLPLEVMWLNGEVVTTKLLEKASNVLPHVGLFNTYSISECGEVCAGPLTFREDCPKFSPVGKLAGFVNHVLMDTETGEPVPKGSAGELWVSGRGVGRGYTNNPKKTAEVFVTHDDTPFYRTGDLARELHDGVFEILGRCDFMVKVRGYSIVLGAVEAAISKLVGVSQCVVVAKGEEGSDKRLVAYLVKSPANENRGRLDLNTAGIDDYGRSSVLFQELLQELPNYSVPSVYVMLDAIPIHPVSTKTDRSALPPPPESPPSVVLPDAFQFDGSEAHTQLVFEEVLKLPAGTLTAESNFFEFGGHSLLASQLLARIVALGGSQVAVADFLRSSTVTGLSSTLRGEVAAADPARLLPREVEKHTHKISDIDMNLQAFWRYIVFTNSSARILLTGATGYVGAHVLGHLLRTTTAQVFCIVRAPKDSKPENANADVLARVVANLESHGYEGLNTNRIQVIAGDVARPNMGLGEDEYLFLQQAVDVVIHAAAGVNLAYSYSLLEAANVHGTAGMINFARGGKVKALHFISTDGIFPETGDVAEFKEDQVPPHHLLHSGYGQTKWVAEQLVADVRRMGLPCVVYRLGNVGGPVEGGGWNPSDSNLLFMRACLDSGSVPEGNNWEIEFTPVDFVAQFISNCVMDLQFANGKTFHLINDSKLPMRLIGDAAKRAGFPTIRTDTSTWCAGMDDSKGLLSVVLGEEALQSLLGRHHSYAQDNVEAACAHFGMTYPKLGSVILDKYMTRLMSEGLLPSNPMSRKLGGRIAVVTGATSEVGEGIATALVQEGATVVLVGEGSEKLQQLSAKLRGAVPIPCDITSAETVQAMVAEVERNLQRIDIVVNCTGGSFMQNGSNDEKVDAMNVYGATLPVMQRAKTGHIVNIDLDRAATADPKELASAVLYTVCGPALGVHEI